MKTYLLLSGLLLSCVPARAVEFPISGGEVTYQQNAPYQINNSFYADAAGWAAYIGPAGPGGQFEAQSAVMTLASPITVPQLVVRMDQSLGGNHYFQKFRLAYTTDAVPGFAGTWTELVPAELSATGGLSLQNAGSNMVETTGGTSAGITTFVVTSVGPFTGVTGLRLELFPVDYNGADGLPATLGHASNGNFALSFFTVSDELNVALQRPVTASAATYPGQNPGNLTDGRTDTLSHPADPPAETNFFYTIDLGRNYVLSRLEFVQRGDCCPERLSNYRVQVLDYDHVAAWRTDVRTDGSNAGFGGTDSVVAGDGAGVFVGRYLRVQNLSGMAYNPQVTEVRAFGVPLVEINWALHHPVTADSTYPGYPAELINDGSAGTNSFSHPDVGATFGTGYTIDLGQEIDLTRLEIVGRNDCCPERLSNYRVRVYDAAYAPVWLGDIRTDGSNAGYAGTDLILPSHGAGVFRGRYLRVENNSGTAYSPQVAEFRAFSTVASNAPFVVENLSLGAGDAFSITFTSVEGMFYLIQYSETMTTWETLLPEVPGLAGSTTFTSFINQTALPALSVPDPEKVYFRVIRP